MIIFKHKIHSHVIQVSFSPFSKSVANLDTIITCIARPGPGSPLGGTREHVMCIHLCVCVQLLFSTIMQQSVQSKITVSIKNNIYIYYSHSNYQKIHHSDNQNEHHITVTIKLNVSQWQWTWISTGSLCFKHYDWSTWFLAQVMWFLVLLWPNHMNVEAWNIPPFQSASALWAANLGAKALPKCGDPVWQVNSTHNHTILELHSTASPVQPFLVAKEQRKHILVVKSGWCDFCPIQECQLWWHGAGTIFIFTSAPQPLNMMDMIWPETILAQALPSAVQELVTCAHFTIMSSEEPTIMSSEEPVKCLSDVPGTVETEEDDAMKITNSSSDVSSKSVPGPLKLEKGILMMKRWRLINKTLDALSVYNLSDELLAECPTPILDESKRTWERRMGIWRERVRGALAALREPESECIWI